MIDIIASKFWSSVERLEGGCLIWHGSKSNGGSGRFVVGKQFFSARRTSFEIHFSGVPIPERISMSCESKDCVAPDHMLYSSELRFWRYVNKIDGGCWEWTGFRRDTGYGNCNQMFGEGLAHRASWVLHRGQIPDSLDVLHACDNPRCVHPDHLFLGDQPVNNSDRDAKGRAARGEGNGLSKLTDDKVREIRSLGPLTKGQMRELGFAYGVNASTIRQVINRETWKHVV